MAIIGLKAQNGSHVKKRLWADGKYEKPSTRGENMLIFQLLSFLKSFTVIN